MEKFMNKQILLQSIKKVAGFLALITGSICVIAFILSNIPTWLGVTLVIVSTFVGLTYLEYKNRASWERFKDGVK
jgi:hypothetical protein